VVELTFESRFFDFRHLLERVLLRDANVGIEPLGAFGTSLPGQGDGHRGLRWRTEMYSVDVEAKPVSKDRPANAARSAPTRRARNDHNPWEFSPFLAVVVVVLGAASLANQLSPPTLSPAVVTSRTTDTGYPQASSAHDATVAPDTTAISEVAHEAIAESDPDTSAGSTMTAATPIPRPRPTSVSDSG